ncbi:hypothetical protein HDU99_005335, partial [Rhizoclosmatium hyalinum]
NGLFVNAAAKAVSANYNSSKEMIRGVYYQMLEHPDRSHSNSVFSDEYETAISALLRRDCCAASPSTIQPSSMLSPHSIMSSMMAYMKEKGYKFQNIMNMDEMLIKLQNNNSQSRKLESTLIAHPGEVKGGRNGFLFPANTTYFLQPLDNVPLANLKNIIACLYKLAKTCLDLLARSSCQIALDAPNCLKPELIHSAFSQTVIFLFNKEKS